MQGRLATVPGLVLAKIAIHMAPPQVLPQTQLQHPPVTDAEIRHGLEPAVEAIHSNTVRRKQSQGCHIHAWLMKPDFLIWPRGRKLASANLGRYSALEVLGKTHDELVNSPC